MDISILLMNGHRKYLVFIRLVVHNHRYTMKESNSFILTNFDYKIKEKSWKLDVSHVYYCTNTQLFINYCHTNLCKNSKAHNIMNFWFHEFWEFSFRIGFEQLEIRFGLKICGLKSTQIFKFEIKLDLKSNFEFGLKKNSN